MIITVLSLGAAITVNLFAQEPSGEGGSRIWSQKVGEGEYMVNLDSVSSISKHHYVIDGSVQVTEVTIDTTGNSLARFYYLEPVSPEGMSDRVEEVTERANELLDQVPESMKFKLHEMVHKKYPVTTHAKTVEFRFLKKKDLQKFHRRAVKAWQRRGDPGASSQTNTPSDDQDDGDTQ